MTDNALMIMQHSREKGWNDTSQAEAAFDDESKKKKLDGESVEKQSPKKCVIFIYVNANSSGGPLSTVVFFACN